MSLTSKRGRGGLWGSLSLGFVVVLIVFLYFASSKTKASWFDDAWRYRVAIPISAHTSDENNVYITLSGSSGINTTDTSKFQGDCGDIRFVNEKGESLPYYLTTACGLSQTGFHVFLSDFPAGSQTIYYYYGNPSATNGFDSSDFETAATGVTVGSAGSETLAPASPTLYFRFDEGYGQTINNSMDNLVVGTLGPDVSVTSTDPSWRSKDICMVEKCLWFNSSSSQYVNVSSTVASAKSVGFWLKPNSLTTSLLVLNGPTGNASLSISSGTISAGAGFVSPTIYINGVVRSNLEINKWQYVVVTTATGITASNIVLGRVNSGYFDGFIDEFKVYSSVLNTTQIGAGYASGLAKSSSIKSSGLSLGSGESDGFFTSGLVGYWKMDEKAGSTTIDLSGNMNTGTLTNSPTWSGGVYGSGVLYSTGTTDKYVGITDSSSISDLQSFTYSFWIKPTELQGNTVIAKSGNLQIYLENVSSTVRLQYRVQCSGGGLEVFSTATNALAVNAWSHVVLTYDGTKGCGLDSINHYVNGVLAEKHANSTAGSGTRTSEGGSPLVLGNSQGYNDQFVGVLDEIRLYNQVLTTSEISLVYNYAPGPVGWWKMDENHGTSTVSDSSGYEHNGTLNNISEGNWVAGKYGSAINFNNANDSISIADNDDFSIDTTGKFTVQAWFNPDDLSLTQEIVNKGSSSNYEWALRINSDASVYGYVYQSGGGSYLETPWFSSGFETHKWYHIVMTVDLSSTDLKLYINGILKAEDTTASGSYTNGSAFVRIGERADGIRDVDGTVDDVKIYNYVRSQSQIIEDMNGQRPTGLTPIGYWKFDEKALNTCAGGTNDFCDSASSNSKDFAFSTTTGGYTSDGKFGSGFNGTGSVWATRADDNDFDFAAGDDFSIALWMRSDSSTNPSSGADQYLFTKGTITNSGTAGYALYVDNNGKVNFGVKDDAAWGTSSPGTPSPDDLVTSNSDVYDGTWHHIVAVKNGTKKIELYVDGILNSSDAVIAATSSLANSISIKLADDDADATNSFAGDVDELAIFRVALTSKQIGVLMKGGESSLLGAVSTSSTGIPYRTNTGKYCVPGDSTTCTPPIAEFDFEKRIGTSFAGTGSLAYLADMAGTAMGEANWVMGKNGKAVLFDGIDDRVDVSSFSFPTGDYTYEFWISPKNFGTSNIILSGSTASTGGYELNIGTDTGGGIDVTSNGSLVASGTDGKVVANKWTHVAVVRSGSSISTYINGQLDVTGTDGTAYSFASCPLTVGAGRSSTNCSSINSSTFFDGSIDDLRIYNYARTGAQVAWDYDLGAPVGYWKFDECEGQTLHDSINKNNTATVTIGAGGTQSSIGACGISGTTAWYTGKDGKNNYSLNFDGTDDYAVRSGDSLPTTDFTIMAWINRAATNNAHTILKVSPGNGTNELKFAVNASDDGSNPNKLRFTTNGNSTYSQSQISQANTWYHVAISRSGSTKRMYINGVLDSVTGNDGVAMSFGSCEMFIGASPSSGCSASLSEYFNGKIDDLRIYNYALNQTQIYNAMSENNAVKFGPTSGSPN